MSNRSRQERARLTPSKPHITAAEQLRTVELYLRTQSTALVGAELGISAAAVRDRLYALGLELRPPGASTEIACVEDVNDPEELRKLVRLLGYLAQQEGQ